MASNIQRSPNPMLTCCISQDRSLLHAAVSSGKTDIVQYLLSEGATPNTSDDEVSICPIPFHHPVALHPGRPEAKH